MNSQTPVSQQHSIRAQLPGTASVSVDKLSKSFGEVAALRDVDLKVAASEMLVLVGPSGCGKTTCLRCIAGLERPTSGRIAIGERVVTAPAEGVFVAPEHREIGMVFQSYAIWPHMTVYENVAYPLRAMGVPRAELPGRVKEALRLVQLDHLGDRYSSQISGGQQQRVALARSLVSKPALLLFDEPLSNLDANLRIQMRVEIKELQNQLGFTGVYVTHDQAEALAIADRIAILKDGVLRQVGTPREVYDRPADTFVAGFMGTTNLMPGLLGHREAGRAVVTLDGGFPLESRTPTSLAPEAKVVVSLRPEALSFAPSAKAGVNAWPATVQRAVFAGGAILYRLSVGPHLIEMSGPPTVAHEPGTSVFVEADPARAVILPG